MQEIKNPVDLLMQAIMIKERGRSRSRQTSIGPSAVGDCRRKVWLKLDGRAETNPTKKLASWFGIAAHERIADGIRNLDPFGERFLVEHHLVTDQVSGTVDCFDKQEGAVIDWKTTKKATLGWLTKGHTLGKRADDWPSQEQRWQVNLYGWMLEQKGYQVNTVNLVGIAKDGDDDHTRVFTEDYEPVFAREALDWIAEVGSMTEAPEPEKSGVFCRSYCGFWSEEGGLCNGREGAAY